MTRNKKQRIIKEIWAIIEDLILSAITTLLIYLIFHYKNWSIAEAAKYFILLAWSKILGRYASHYWKQLTKDE